MSSPTNQQKLITLSNGVKMPALGLGTWQSTPEQVKSAVKAAVEAGYRFIDTAWAYRNEKEIGDALQDLFKNGTVKREDLFITTKLHGYYHTADEVAWAIRDSLKNLQMDYVDLFLIHGPIAYKKMEGTIFPIVDGKIQGEHVDHMITWKGMEKLYKEGLAKAIGLSNFNSQQIQNILDHAEIKPHNLQEGAEKETGKEAASTAPPGALIQDPVVKAIADKHNKTPAQVLLRWLIQRNISVIPKSVTPSRIVQNLQVWDFELNDKECEQLIALKKKNRLHLSTAAIAGHLPDYPFNIPF